MLCDYSYFLPSTGGEAFRQYNMFILSAFLITLCLAIILGGVAQLLRKKVSADKESRSSFECGFDRASKSFLPVSFRFFILALVFLVFDVELILLFPILLTLSSSFCLFFYASFNFLLLTLGAGLFIE